MSRPAQGGTSYRAVLMLPNARGPFAAALLARLCYGLQGLPLLITLRNATGSYAVAAAAASVFGLAVAVLAPARARLVQRHASALMMLATCYALALSALAGAGALRAPAGIAFGMAVLAGLFPPPVGPLMRALWSRLAPDKAYLQRALSLDTAAETATFALGPALAGALIAAFGAPAVLFACPPLILAGCGLLAKTTRAVRPSLPGGRGGTARSRVTFGPHGFHHLLLLTCIIAAAVGAANVAAVAAWGPLTAGILLALFSVGGVAGGLAYGHREWYGPLARRPRKLAAGSAACYAIPPLAFMPAVAGAALLLAGACADILLVTAYQLVDALVAENHRAEAGAWLNTAYNLGAAMGAAAGGILVDRAGPLLSFAIIAAATGTCAALPARGARRTDG